MKISMTSKDVLHPDECDVRVNYEPVTSVHSDEKSTHNFIEVVVCSCAQIMSR